MKKETVSTVYAAALLDLAGEKGQVESVHGEVLSLEKLLREDATLRTFFESPKIERAEKHRVIESSMRGRLSDSVVNLIQVVIRKGRALFLREILEEIKLLHDKRIGLVHATALSAVPLSEASVAALRGALEAKLSKRVDVENKLDPEILGGLVVRYDGMVADGSLRTALAKVAAGMKAVKFGSQLVHEN